MALVGIGHPLVLRMEIISPGIEVAGEAAAGTELVLDREDVQQGLGGVLSDAVAGEVGQ